MHLRSSTAKTRGIVTNASCLILILAVVAPLARPDFWSVAKGEQPASVKLVRKLPAVAARNGNTVHFTAEIAEPSTPAAVLPVLREKVRTLLLSGKAGGIQLVDGPADTTIKCVITGYEPKIVKKGVRQVGNKTLAIETWVGNLRGSVQVLDGRNNPLDGAELKEHLEKDYVTAQNEQAITAVNDKKATKSSKFGSLVNVVRGGPDIGDVTSLGGGGKSLHDSLGPESRTDAQPTDLEWRDQMIEAFAAKVANRIVPVDQEFSAMLPLDKEFSQIREFARNQRWGDVQEQAEKIGQMQGTKEAFRLYLLALSYEAIAYQNADHPENATESLNKSSKYYSDAAGLQPSEHEFLLAQIRARDSLDHYLEIAHYIQNRPAVSSAPSPAPAVASPVLATSAAPVAPKKDVADNDALIAMAQAGLPDAVLISFIQNTADPRFDVSAGGLVQLAKAKVPASVIQAVQKKMAPASAPQRRTPAPAATKPVPAHNP